jgi:hypothetical protein
VVQRQSTLQTCDDWVNEHEVVERIAGSKRIYRIEEMDKLEAAVHYFGDNVAFDKEAWMAGT